jgi:hypothetical protein
VIHVDAEALATDDEARCELAAGTPLPREAARRLGCDASIVRILERDGKPLSVGRKTRTVAPGLRRALRARDQGCMFPGCTQIHHVDAHHIEHWADGGRTDLNNLVLLCRRHHRLLHEGGFRVRRTPQGLVFSRPDGRTLPNSPRPLRGDCAELVLENARRHISASANALMPQHGPGERLDRAMAVDGVMRICGRRRE